jgi:hypothetical protein
MGHHLVVLLDVERNEPPHGCHSIERVQVQPVVPESAPGVFTSMPIQLATAHARPQGSSESVAHLRGKV